MSNFLDDVNTGLKGIRGAGDALRGELMEAVDQTFDNNPSHPTTAAVTNKHHTIAEKGKADISAADEMVARHEQAHREKKAAKTGAAGAAFSNSGAQTGAAPVATHETSADAYGSGAAASATEGYGGNVNANTAASTGQVPVGQTQTGAPGTVPGAWTEDTASPGSGAGRSVA